MGWAFLDGCRLYIYGEHQTNFFMVDQGDVGWRVGLLGFLPWNLFWAAIVGVPQQFASAVGVERIVFWRRDVCCV